MSAEIKNALGADAPFIVRYLSSDCVTALPSSQVTERIHSAAPPLRRARSLPPVKYGICARVASEGQTRVQAHIVTSLGKAAAGRVTVRASRVRARRRGRDGGGAFNGRAGARPERGRIVVLGYSVLL